MVALQYVLLLPHMLNQETLLDLIDHCQGYLNQVKQLVSQHKDEELQALFNQIKQLKNL